MINKPSLTIDVLIIGAGPVGLILANFLKRSGISVLIVDKQEKRSNLPKGIAINQSTLQILNILGISSVFQKGKKIEKIDLYLKGRHLGAIDFKSVTTEYPFFFHITQNEIEKLLEESLQHHDLSVNYGLEFKHFIQKDKVVYSYLAENEQEIIIKSKFLVGCDGGHSKVREVMGCGVDKENYQASFALADVELKNYNYSCTKYIFSKEGYVMIVPLPENKYRLIFSLLQKIPGENLSDGFFQKLLSERSGKEMKIKNIFWKTSSSFGHKLSKKTYQDRVILAGDSLHQFSPVGGTNMNVGIQDAYVLAWILLHSLNKSKSFLSIYEENRKKMIKKQQLDTEWITALITRSKKFPKNYEKDFDFSNELTGYLETSLEDLINNAGVVP